MSNSKYSKTYLFSRNINYSDTDLLGEYITEQGKILPRRITGLSAKKQREVARSIKRARMLSLIPFSSK